MWNDLKMGTVVALAIATLLPLLFAYGMYMLDVYQTRSRWYILYCFIWGIFSYAIAVFVNVVMIEREIVSLENVLRFSAPVVEETLKGILLYYLVRRGDFAYFVDGAIYGFAGGVGFAVVENYEYVLGSSAAALSTAMARVFSTNLIHAAGSGVIGISLGIARLQHSRRRFWWMAAGLILAFGLHIGFNNLVTRVTSGLQVVLAVAVGFGAAVFVFMAIRRGLQDERLWIEETLDHLHAITPQESSLVKREGVLDELLQPLAEVFGPRKMELVEQFLTIQAQLGILQKTLEVFRNQNDEKMAARVQAQMDGLHKKMDRIRRSIGAYHMLYLRGTFLQGSGRVWDRLESIIQQRYAGGTKPGGMNLWSLVEQRIQSPASKGKEQNHG